MPTNKPRPKELEGLDDNQLRQMYEQRKAARASAQPQMQQQVQPQQVQPQGQDINSLIQTLTKAQQPTMQQTIGDALMRLGGGTPAPRKDYTDLIVKEQLERSRPKTELEQLVERGRAVDAAKSIGNRGIYDSLVGGGQPQTQQTLEQQNQSTQESQQMTAPEIDPFTGKPTSKGLQQELQNKLIEQNATQDMRLKVPTAKQKEDVTNIANAKVTIDLMEKDAAKLPSGLGGIKNNIQNFFSRGETNPDLLTYNDARPSNSISIYKMLTGDNRLSDFDAERALGLTWDSDEGPTVRTRKFARMKNLLAAREKLIKSGQYTVTKDGDFITPISMLESVADQTPTGNTNQGGDDLSAIEAELAQINAQLGQ